MEILFNGMSAFVGFIQILRALLAKLGKNPVSGERGDLR
jgi:hypothetical protein